MKSFFPYAGASYSLGSFGRSTPPSSNLLSSPVGTYRIVNPSLMSQRETALWLPLALMWVRFEVPVKRVEGEGRARHPPGKSIQAELTYPSRLEGLVWIRLGFSSDFPQELGLYA